MSIVLLRADEFSHSQTLAMFSCNYNGAAAKRRSPPELEKNGHKKCFLSCVGISNSPLLQNASWPILCSFLPEWRGGEWRGVNLPPRVVENTRGARSKPRMRFWLGQTMSSLVSVRWQNWAKDRGHSIFHSAIESIPQRVQLR